MSGSRINAIRRRKLQINLQASEATVNAAIAQFDPLRPDAPDRPRSNPSSPQTADWFFPEVADAIRAKIDAIVFAWAAAAQATMPRTADVKLGGTTGSTSERLLALADGFACNAPDEAKALINRFSAKGMGQFISCDVADVMQGDRLLRSITVEQVEAKLGRRTDVRESAALHTAIDVMFQQSLLGIVNQQKVQLSESAATELTYLSFLSHDLNNNLGNITLFLSVLQDELKGAKGFEYAHSALLDAQQAIQDTVGGMRQMLAHARLQNGAFSPILRSVELGSIVTLVVAQCARMAQLRGITFAIEVTPCEVVKTNAELLTLVLQNLVGNAVKYSSNGVVRVQSGRGRNGSQCVLRVSDEGPGIKDEDKARIFDAFQRGKACGQEGIGLGLAIASQAAKLLNAHLSVESKVGKGSTFQLTIGGEAMKPEQSKVYHANRFPISRL